jgi:hypothetical protein
MLDNRSPAREHLLTCPRGECERLFCKTMKTVFLGEEGHAGNNGFIAMGANTHSPPDERLGAYTNYFDDVNPGQGVDAWLEIWDYRGGCSFRGFVGGRGDQKSLFAFFDPSIIGRDLKQGYATKSQSTSKQTTNTT